MAYNTIFDTGIVWALGHIIFVLPNKAKRLELTPALYDFVVCFLQLTEPNVSRLRLIFMGLDEAHGIRHSREEYSLRTFEPQDKCQ